MSEKQVITPVFAMAIKDDSGAKKRTIKTGEVIFESRPFVLVLDRRWKFQVKIRTYVLKYGLFFGPK